MAGSSDAQSVCVTPNEFFLPGTGEAARCGVLLIHGLTGTPNEMRLLGKGLNRAGYTVYAVQLAGHCGTHDDLLRTRWQDWAQTVHEGAERLRGQVDRMFVVGLSMGAVLALELASEKPQMVSGVGALSTMFRYDGWSMPFYTRLSFLLKIFRLFGIGKKKLFLEQPPYGIKDEALRERIVSQMSAGDSAAAGLTGNPWYSVIEMRALAQRVQQRLSRITAPCLVIHAREDDISSAKNAELVARKVSGPVEFVLLENSYHMITVDRERRTVTEKTAEFVKRFSADASLKAA
jgi:carboxylesterase